MQDITYTTASGTECRATISHSWERQPHNRGDKLRATVRRTGFVDWHIHSPTVHPSVSPQMRDAIVSDAAEFAKRCLAGRRPESTQFSTSAADTATD